MASSLQILQPGSFQTPPNLGQTNFAATHFLGQPIFALIEKPISCSSLKPLKSMKILQPGPFQTSPNLGSTNFAPTHFLGQPIFALIEKPISCSSLKPLKISASYCVSKSMRWWEKTLKQNMVEIQSGQELVHELNSAGDRLVIVDFYSPACGACKFLHPKICQLAESNPDALILKVNQEELKNMCDALHVHVLPFFRFYKGSQGHLCSFSCTLSTIKKFKDAMAKHSSESQPNLVLDQAKGLKESELMSLSSIGEISLSRIQETQMPFPVANEKLENLFIDSIKNAQEDKSFAVA